MVFIPATTWRSEDNKRPQASVLQTEAGGYIGREDICPTG